MDMQLAEKRVFTKTETFVVVVAGVLVCTWKGNIVYIRYRSGCEHQNMAPPPFKEGPFPPPFFFVLFFFFLFSRLLCLSALRGAPYLSLSPSLLLIRENDVL